MWHALATLRPVGPRVLSLALPYLVLLSPPSQAADYLLSLHDALPICEHGTDDRGVFVQHYQTDALDASLLLLTRSEEHTSELQSLRHIVCRLLLEKKKYTDVDLEATSLLVNSDRFVTASDALGTKQLV